VNDQQIDDTILTTVWQRQTTKHKDEKKRILHPKHTQKTDISQWNSIYKATTHTTYI